MPLFSTRRKISDTENKLRLLYCLNALGMATQEELWPFAAQLDLMDYVPLCVYLDELRSDGAVTSGSHALEGVLYLSTAGEQQLSLFLSKLPPADRERIDAAAGPYREKLSTRKQVRAAYAPPPEGGFGAALTMREGDVPTLFVRLSTQDERLAEKAVRGFAACAPLVLNLLYTVDLKPGEKPVPAALSQDEAIAQAAPGHPALCAFGGREHAAVVQLEDELSCYTVLLLLPTAELAWEWAQSADGAGRAIASALNVLFLDAAEDTKQ